MSAITTHILDTASGTPAQDVIVRLDRLEDGDWKKIGGGSTNSDGRIPDLVDEGVELSKGHYRLEFVVSDYFQARGVKSFYPYVNIVFLLDETDSHYHVPLLLSPFGYSTYRGS